VREFFGRLLDTMKVNDPNLGTVAGLNSTGVSKAAQTGRPAGASGAATVAAQGDAADGVQLSGLAQQLQALSADSPERDAKVESLARTYAQGNYQIDAEATASGMIDDALRYSKNS
jgi:flagellar biosynthesis anti-sigma factor FlgM